MRQKHKNFYSIFVRRKNICECLSESFFVDAYIREDTDGYMSGLLRRLEASPPKTGSK